VKAGEGLWQPARVLFLFPVGISNNSGSVLVDTYTFCSHRLYGCSTKSFALESTGEHCCLEELAAYCCLWMTGVVTTLFCCVFPMLTPMVFFLFRAQRDASQQIYFWHLWNQLPMVFYLRGMIVPSQCRKKDKDASVYACFVPPRKSFFFFVQTYQGTGKSWITCKYSGGWIRNKLPKLNLKVINWLLQWHLIPKTW